MNHRVLTTLLFVTYLLVGWFVVDDYGITFDEGIQRQQGLTATRIILDKLGIEHPDMRSQHNYRSQYGMLFQTTAVLVELATGALGDSYRFYRIRHIMGFLLYGLALLFFYRTLRIRWPDRRWYPLLGTALLLLTPRLFAHAFFNPKDHILLVFYVIATYTLANYLRKRSTGALAWHVVATALALNSRLPALIIVGATAAILSWEYLTERRPATPYRYWHLPAYLIGSFLLMLPLFPYLWSDPVTNMATTLATMTTFPYGGDNQIFATYFKSGETPFWYLPAWIAITTPVAYLLFIGCGVGLTAVRAVSALRRGRLWDGLAGQLDVVQLGLSVGPLLLVIGLHAVVYNGWRHVHFIYPGLVFLALTGFAYLRARWPRATPVILGAGMLWTAINMVRMHPNQQVYFNEAIHGDYLAKRFDMDYWGASYRGAFIALAKQVPDGETRRIKCLNWPCIDNLQSMPPPYRGKLIYEPKYHLSDYVATNFLYPTERTALADRTDVFVDPVLEVAPRGDIIVGIYRLNY